MPRITSKPQAVAILRLRFEDRKPDSGDDCRTPDVVMFECARLTRLTNVSAAR
jgi:hypothetical protein